MEIGVVGIVVAIVCGLASYLVTRWFARRGQKKAEAERVAAQALESRQVRRARKRRGGG